jgi:hypothetical protein
VSRDCHGTYAHLYSIALNGRQDAVIVCSQFDGANEQISRSEFKFGF